MASSNPFGDVLMFNINQCHICQITARETVLKRCGGCLKVSYCTVTHQKMDWNKHKKFCKVIQNVEERLPEEDLGNSENWMNYRKKMLQLYEEETKRRPIDEEIAMVFFPGRCEVCRSKNARIVCLSCLGSNYCSKQHQDLDAEYHSKLCKHLKFIENSGKQLVMHPRPDYSLRKGALTLPENMKEFIDTRMDITSRSSGGRIYHLSFLSNLISYSLTFLYGLKLLSYEMKNTLTVHIAGSSYMETTELLQWEIIPHIYHNIKRLNIVFIGPDVEPPRLNDLCKSCRKVIKIELSKDFYHDYVSNGSSKKPDIICAFNCGFYTYGTWIPSFPHLVRNVPLIMSSFVDYEAEKDIKALLDTNPKAVYTKKRNPFSGLNPLKRAWYDDFSYINKYIIVFPNKSEN